MGYSSNPNGQRHKRANISQNKDIGICIFCDLPVYRKDDELRYVPIERPVRIDLPVHKSCYRHYAEEGVLRRFIQDNILNYIKKYVEDEENVKAKKKITRNQ